MNETKSDPIVGIIEDDTAVRASLVALLSSIGLDAVSFANAEEFLNAHADSAPDFLIVDIRLPGMSGPELLENLAAANLTPPAVLVTGHSDDNSMQIPDRSAALRVLSKPCDPEELIELISTSIATKP